jgi:hypothetical protein
MPAMSTTTIAGVTTRDHRRTQVAWNVSGGSALASSG